LLAGSVVAQTADEGRVIPSKERTFRIPFQTQANGRALREVQLMVSADQGRTWRLSASAAPEQGFFQQYTAPQDGLYWFAVRTMDVQGQPYPATDAQLRAGLRVLVDTVPPTVFLEALPPRDGAVGVKWEVRDENLELATIRLEYQVAGTNQWAPIRIDPVASGSGYWTPMTNGALEVRMSVSDSVGQVGRASVNVGGGGGANPNVGGAVVASPHPAASAPQAPMRIVNSKRISLNYKIDNVGPSGVSAVKLWYTQDGRGWQEHSEVTKEIKPPYVVDVAGEGVYGFTLVVRSGVGLGEKPPQVGDPPHVWVEVDLTPPVVQLHGVEVGQGTATGKLTVTWTATDKNLGASPINLSYAENPDGPWTPITPAPVENTGRYIWQMPSGVPYQFHVRVEAIDKAGNVGHSVTRELVKVDLAKPKPTILDVSPAGK